MTQPILVVQKLRTQFRLGGKMSQAVRNVSFDLHAGEILGIVGESGSGKTTVLMSILRLLPENALVLADSIRFNGRELTSLSNEEMRLIRGREISLIPQRPMSSLSPVTRVGTQVNRFLAARASPDDRRGQAISSILDRVGLRAVQERLRGYPSEFSGGQLQRLLIAIAALAARPKILFADEPTSTLDATVQAQILALLVGLRKDLGLSIIFVTHDLGVVAQICDRVAVMYAGELVELADIQTLFADPRHPYTQALLNTIPSRHKRGERLPAIEGSVADTRVEIQGCAFAPRCQHVMERCRHEAPAERQAGASVVRCHLYPEDH